MKFKDKYPNQVIDSENYNPVSYLKLEKTDVRVDNGMCRTNRFYECRICRQNTDWIDTTLEGLCFCSEECRMEFMELLKDAP